MTDSLEAVALAYVIGSVTCGGLVYAGLPLVARTILARLVTIMGAALRQGTRQRREQWVQRGCDTVLTGPQAMLIGHLVVPHLERFAGLLFKELESSESDAMQPLLRILLAKVEARRWWIAIGVSQVVMMCISCGFLLRGYISHD